MKLSILTLACTAALLTLAGCGSDSSSSASAPAASQTLSGVAAQGVAVVGVPVTLTDSTGATLQTAATDANGNFSLSFKGGKAPFVLTVPVNDSDGSPAVLSAIVASGSSTTANLNPLTTLVTQRALGQTLTAAPTAAQLSAANPSAASIAQAVTDVDTVLQPLFTALGVPSSAVNDPVGASYSIGSALDKLFDIAHITVHNNTISVGQRIDASGQTVAADGSSTYQSLQLPLTGKMPNPLANGPVVAAQSISKGATTTPIQHVIVIVAENQTFDGLFGTYQTTSDQTVKNLLSQGIVNADGTPGPNFALAAQNKGTTQTSYTLNPTRGSAYATLLQPEKIGIVDLSSLSTAGGVADTRFPANLPNGPFQISKYVPYAQPDSSALGVQLGLSATTGDPVHRFFQMWQQTGGDNSKLDMFMWVAAQTGQGGDTSGITPSNPAQGGELMGFMNMSAGDAPYFNTLARTYAISDNYHQSVMGGTGMNFFQVATGDMPYFNNAGTVATPPSSQIENPNPLAGTDNFYQQDGYSGGSYVGCGDATQPGVQAILTLLTAKGIASNCDAGKYYLVNNYNPGYATDGTTNPIGPNNYNYPPQTVPTIAEALANANVSWKWYTGGRDAADVTTESTLLAVSYLMTQQGMTQSQALAYVATNPGLLAQFAPSAIAAQYNVIGDPLVASSKVMTNAALKANLVNLTTFDHDVASNTLPAVSYVVPKNLASGHPGYSAPADLEAYLKHIVDEVKANPALWANTAILITTDEGGGHFDTGPIQNLDFFGDGPRIPMVVVSPYARAGMVDHTYYDHASVLKFIERNWKLAPLSKRSRDRLPNPVQAQKAYLPTNKTAVGDLMAMFNF
ncbi:alkaline phosphatase family protein [Silvimonas iriomotensis]|uniref:Phosphoesterase n=1 Tax=Silvimonas iriomotensis TaxID=449662 RepID=A0ABQ2PAB8_9NEIS|nr:alkaline phosphatase family protein [Silvimonas iriomotensis]GGP22325.1 hypothetical protein GCM10010970_24670 [Silvimonas iriomotensis]